jgi:hypothetical protein
LRNASRLPVALALLLLPAASPAAGTKTFDGVWLTTLSCPPAQDAPGYSHQFVSTVKGGELYGVYGTVGEASSLELDGSIAPDGSAKLYVQGRTGSTEYDAPDTPRGAPYSYSVEAHFAAASGSGTRVETRPCAFQFAKKKK